MRPILALSCALALGLACPTPADAHIVYFKDGTVVRGLATVKDANVVVKGPDSEMSFPLATVRAISFTDEPIAYEQQRVEDTKFFNNEALVWSMVAANLAAIVVAAVTLRR